MRIVSQSERLISLPLHDLAERHHGVTQCLGDSYTEAARVCLSRHHASPQTVTLEDSGAQTESVVEWTAPDDRTRGAYANETDATRDGAYACVLAAVELLRGMFAVHRAETKTGADYYVGPMGTGSIDLERCFRLEVSGVDHGTDVDVKYRLTEKLAQAGRGVSNLPAIAGVVGFKARLISIAPLEQK
jgi:hypothetical protein